MVKKINKEKQLKMKVAELKEMLIHSNSERDRFDIYLEQIKRIFAPKETYGSLLKYSDLPMEVIKLQAFKSYFEGSIPHGYDTIEAQREIIRWLIKPSSADNSKELADLKKSMGMKNYN